ncbi:tetratricopeptide repeat protein [Streptomyces sp. KR55]|uniref:tetratricopeptide repeat protein n=1 Tax=Streptomyces sp. KR55 TaxID=3457425 RepID=UPI003FD0C6A9
MTSAGPDPELVVQIRARPSFGTGYRIAPGLVLTAAHVVTGADGERPDRVTVARLGQDPTDGDVVWCRRDAAADAALIRLRTHSAESPGRAPVTRYGSFVSAQPDQRVEAIGFPRAQKFETLRDQEHFSGLVSPATGAGSGHYEFTSTTPMPAGPSGETRPQWAGMSGAAVFAGGLLVGVVRQDRRPRWGTRLTATPLSALLADEAFRRTVAEAVGREPLCEPVELSGFLASPYPSRDIPSVVSLLRADSETVSFHGREAVCARLADWCAGPEATSVLIVTGQGGEGKSRLARWFLARQRDHGWTAGLLRRPLTDDAVTEERFSPVARARGPLLLAVDYAENHPHQVRALLRQARSTQGPVRLLLLARERGVWAEALEETDAAVRDLLAEAPALALEPLAPTDEDWDASFRRSLHDIARALPAVPGHRGPDWAAFAERIAPPPADTHHRANSALGIQMTALTLLLQQAVPLDTVRGEPVERTLLRHEESYWTLAARRCGLRGFDRTTLRSAVAALHLVTVADQAQAVALLDTLGVGGSDRGLIAARWLHELYPPAADAYCGSVQPDRIAEFLLVTACADDGDLLTRIVSAAAHCADPPEAAHFAAHPDEGDIASFGQMTALREAVRAARSQAHFGHPVYALLDQIEHTASLPMLSDETLAWAVTNTQILPEAGMRQQVTQNADGSMRITGGVSDEASAALSVAGYRRGAHGIVRSDARQRGFAHMLHAMSLTQLGRREEALDVCTQAVEAFRSAPGSEAELAMQLDQQAQLLLGLGRQDEAVDALCEAVRLRTPTGPATDEEQLRPLLDRLVLTLCRLGRFTQARPYARQETDLLRRQAGAGTDPEAARRYLIALGRYAQVLEGSADPVEALACCTRAEAFLTGLPAEVRDELIAERALLADTKAQVHSALHDRPVEVATWLEAADLWQRLSSPYQGLDPTERAVMALNNAAVGHTALGHHSTALGLIRDAVELALGERGEPVRRDRPELYEQVHATYVGYLAFGEDRAEDALREAERLRARPRPSGTPLPSHFALSLRQVSVALAATGRLALAKRASGLALDTLQALTPSPDDPNLPLILATVLVAHSANLAETDEPAEGAEAAARAADILRRASATEPGLRISLAQSLFNRSSCLHLIGRHADAAEALNEATGIAREQARGDRQLLPMLADMLNQQATCHSETGDHAAAADARSEEATIRYELWRTDPSAGPRAARALADLSTNLQDTGRLPDALSAAKAALGIYHELYGYDPGEHWREVVHALTRCGTALLKSGAAADAVAPFAHALAMCLEEGAMDLAAACRSAIDTAHAMDPAGAAAEWRRLVGSDLPD